MPSRRKDTFICIGEKYNKKISNLISKIARKKSEMYGKHKIHENVEWRWRRRGRLVGLERLTPPPIPKKNHQ